MKYNINQLLCVIIIIILCYLIYRQHNNKLEESFTSNLEQISGYRQRGYRGLQNKTKSGKTCQRWTSQSPQGHSRTPAKYPNMGLGDHNYCRNPDREPGGIWCYTTDRNKRWEYCGPIAKKGELLINPSKNRYYSTIWSLSKKHGNTQYHCKVPNDTGSWNNHARSLLNSNQAWSAENAEKNKPSTNKSTSWMIIDAGKNYDVQGLVLQSRNKGCCTNQYTKQIEIYAIPDGKLQWNKATNKRVSNVEMGTVTIENESKYKVTVNNKTIINTNLFDEKTDSNKGIPVSVIRFNKPVGSRYVKIRIISYNIHPSLRAGLLVKKYTPKPCTRDDCNNHGTASGIRPNCKCVCDTDRDGDTCNEKTPIREYGNKLGTFFK